jgi:hypothetical protein
MPLEAQLTEANPPPPVDETGEEVVDPIEKAACEGGAVTMDRRAVTSVTRTVRRTNLFWRDIPIFY